MDVLNGRVAMIGFGILVGLSFILQLFYVRDFIHEVQELGGKKPRGPV